MTHPGRTCEIGCGGTKVFPESIGVDLRRLKGVDILADARMLPFKNESFEKVYSSHTIEHISHTEVGDVLREWTRILRRAGTLEVRCPDLRARSLLFALRPTWKSVRDIYGEQDYDSNYHRCGFSYGLLRHALRLAGVDKVNRIYGGYKGIPFVPGDLHVRGKKRGDWNP